jgi:hypothetical protein
MTARNPGESKAMPKTKTKTEEKAPTKPEGIKKPPTLTPSTKPLRTPVPKEPHRARRQPVPLELAGKWLAWSADRLKILGHGEGPEEAIAMAGGGDDLVISYEPPASQLRSRRV